MGFISQTKFSGMYSLRRSFAIPPGYAAESLNGDLSSDSEASPLKGYSLFGHQNNVSDKIVRKFTYSKGDGTFVQLQVRDDATNYIVEYLNIEDVRNSALGEWLILEAGLSRTITLTDGNTRKAHFGFTSFNDTGTDQLVYGNAVEVMRVWNGATGAISSTTATTITITGSRTWAQRGFGATGSVIINGNTYAYTGGSGTTTITGVTGDPTGEANGSGIAQVVNTSTLSAADKGSIMLTALSRIFLAGMTATPNQVTFSDTGDITNYAGSNPSDGGFEDFPQMNGAITALMDLNKWIVVFSAKKILAFTFEYPTSTTRTTAMEEIANEGCVNPKAIKKFGDKIIYTTPNGGIKSLTNIAQQDTFSVEDLTEPIRPTIQNFVWDDASLEYSRKKRIMVLAGKSDSTKDDNDAGVMLFLTIREDGSQGWNLGVHDWFIGDMCDYDGDIHFGSSIESQNFLAFDGYSKNGGPISWRRVERVEFFADRKSDGAWTKKYMSFIGFRGVMGPGTKLLMNLDYGTKGAVTSQPLQLKYEDLNSDGVNFVQQVALNTLGGFALGTEPLGGTVENIGELSYFKVIYPLPTTAIEDYQLTMETTGTGQRVVVDTVGYFVEESEQDITENELHDVGQSV